MTSEPRNRYPEERRIATILFADVHGFTPLAEQLDDETVSDLIKGIWMNLDKVIEFAQRLHRQASGRWHHGRVGRALCRG